MRTPAEAYEALLALPCGARPAGVDAWLVGGAVRDLLLGRDPKDLDLVCEGDAEAIARALGEVVEEHGRFGTYEVHDGACRFNVVRARRESYAAPGALPDVAPGTLDEDLARRDFTVNAIALRGGGEGSGGPYGEGGRGPGGEGSGGPGGEGGRRPGGEGRGAELRAVPGALEDLEARVLRVLHPGSFRDDPTRLWRLVRYAVRLGFRPEPGTDRLAVEAVRGGALATVSGDRLGAELRLALHEPDPLAALHGAQNLGLVERLALDPALVAQALRLLPPAGRADLTLLGAVVPDGDWARGWGFTAAEERVVARCAALAPVAAGRPSEVVERLRGEPVEAVAVAGARGDRETAMRYLDVWRHVGLEIDGDDLLAAGIAEGPEVGERLRRTLAARLDGELEPGREAELAEALREAP